MYVNLSLNELKSLAKLSNVLKDNTFTLLQESKSGIGPSLILVVNETNERFDLTDYSCW